LERTEVSEHDDTTAIIQILNLYALALDSHQWDLFERIFTDDVRAEFGPASAAWPDRAALVSAFDDFHRTLDGHQHTMMGHLVHVEGDKAYAFTYGNWLLIRHAAEGGPTWHGTGWYDDELVRTDEGWRIKHRISRLISYSGNPDVPQPVGDQTPDHTGHVIADEIHDIRYFKAITSK
jgi:3-phenylpropionate/cinnamic acid dioxygenase small subunit